MLSEAEIAAVRKQSFEHHAKNQAHLNPQRAYPVDRGFSPRHEHIGGRKELTLVSGYDDDLPKIQGLTLSQLIDRKVVEGNGVSIADLGFGRARVLIEATKRWPGSLQDGFGVAAYLFPPHPDLIKDLPGETLEEKLAGKKIRLMAGDVQDPEVFALEKGKFDVTFSNQVAQHLADPWALVEHSWDITREGGVGLISGVPFPVVGHEMLKELLEEKGLYMTRETVGYTARGAIQTIYDIAFVKQGELVLPLEREAIEESWPTNIIKYSVLG